MYYRWSCFFKFWSGNPHCLEGWEWRNDWSSNPDTVFSLGRGLNSYFHRWRGQSFQFLVHSLSHSFEHCASSWQNNILVKIFPDIHITLHNWVKSKFVNSIMLSLILVWRKQKFRAFKSLFCNCNYMPIWKFVGSFIRGWLRSFFQRIIVIWCNKA